MAHTSTGYGPRSRLYYDGDPNKYQIWETRFLSFLYTQDKAFHKAILPKAPSVADDTDFDESNKTAYAELVQVLDERSLMLIMNDAPNDGRAALKILRQHYASTEKPRVLTLYEELTTLVMNDHEDITDYLIRGERAATGLRSAGEQISDNLVIAMLLKGLPESFKPFVVVHTQLDKVNTLSEFKAQLRNYASTEAIRKENTSVLAARAATNRQSHNYSNQNQMPCNACGDSRHKTYQCPQRSNLTCNYCSKPFHNEAACHTKKRDQQQSQQTSVSAHTVTDQETFLFKLQVIDKAHHAAVSATKGKLIVDSGATSHILNDASHFISYDKSFNPVNHYVEVADGHMSNEIVTARGKARYIFHDSNGKPREFILDNALLAPKFPTNLFSVHAAVNKGAYISFSNNNSYLQAGSTRFTLTHDMNLYYLPISDNSTAQPPKTELLYEPEPEPGVSLCTIKAKRTERPVSEQSDSVRAQDHSNTDDPDTSLADQVPTETSCPSDASETVQSARPERIRRKPPYLQDYYLSAATIDFAYSTQYRTSTPYHYSWNIKPPPNGQY